MTTNLIQKLEKYFTPSRGYDVKVVPNEDYTTITVSKINISKDLQLQSTLINLAFTKQSNIFS